MLEQKYISVDKLEVNAGQFYDLPQNPRFIRDNRFANLKKSIADAPEMLSLRELLVYPLENGNYIVIGGNMRYRACKELGYEKIPCKIIDKETPVQKLREYTIKDNEGFGQTDWDILANEWAQEELEAWGMETFMFGESKEEDIASLFEEECKTSDDKKLKVTIEIPSELEDAMKEIKDTLKVALENYDGVKIS